MYHLKIVLLLLNILINYASGQLPKLVVDYECVDHCPLFFAFVAGGIFISAFVRAMLKILQLSVSPNLFLVIIGILIGIMNYRVPETRPYTIVVKSEVDYILALVIPALLFRSAFCIDTHTFLRSWMQILLISVIGVIINTTFVAFIARVMVDQRWSIAEGYMFGCLSASIYSQSVTSMLKDLGHQTKHLVCLFDGESMVGLYTLYTIFDITNKMEKFVNLDALDIFVITLWTVFMGILLGFVFGFFLCLIIHSKYNDPITVVLLIFISPYLVYYVTNTYVRCSGILAVIIIGIMLSLERPGLTAELDQFLMCFWAVITNITESLVSLQLGVFAGWSLGPFLKTTDLPLIVISYVVCTIGRFLAFLAISPILSRIEYGFTLKKMVLMICGGMKSVIAVSIASMGMENIYGPFGTQLFTHIIGLYLLTLVINGTSMRLVLKMLNMTEVSVARRTNMTTCVKYVLSRRECSISMLKMDRFLSDANWTEVLNATMIKHPYKELKSSEKTDEEDVLAFGFRQTTCPDCLTEVTAQPTSQEIKDMTKEAKLRILKAQKACYLRQYGKGLLTKDGIRVLITTVELATDSNKNWIEIEGLLKLFTKETPTHKIRRKLLNLFFRAPESKIRCPPKKFRAFCFKVIMNPLTDLTIFAVICLNSIQIAIELQSSQKTVAGLSLALSFCNMTFLLVYLLEFVFKIFAYSYTYIWKDGFRTYFSSGWNMFDFVILVVAFVDVIFDVVDASVVSFSKSENFLAKFIVAMKLLRTLRVVRLVHMCKIFYPKFVKYCDSRIDMRTAFAYEIGKSFVLTQQEVLEMLPQMIDYVSVREAVRKGMERDKLLITRELGLIQKERPWIAVTVKTKQAMLATLNTMTESIDELKMQGWADDFEHAKLMSSIKKGMKFVRTIKSIAPLEPKLIFAEVCWLAGDKEASDFLYEHANTKVFDIGDKICSEGIQTEGIFIVITGLCKLAYVPSKLVLEVQADNGRLPIVDYIRSPRFDHNIEEYVISGNTLGEIATITGRTYDCNIVAETPSQVYILTKEVFQLAMAKSSDPVHGLKCRVWKYISINLVISILNKIPAYQSQNEEKLKVLLERCFVPDLSTFKVFIVSHMIEDIILIEGVVVDFNSKERFVGPCYISRTIQKIILMSASSMNLLHTEVKLLIIPAKDVDEYDLMAEEEAISELLPDAPLKRFKVLYKKRKKKARRAVFSIKKSSNKSVDEVEPDTRKHSADSENSSRRNSRKLAKDNSEKLLDIVEEEESKTALPP